MQFAIIMMGDGSVFRLHTYTVDGKLYKVLRAFIGALDDLYLHGSTVAAESADGNNNS